MKAFTRSRKLNTDAVNLVRAVYETGGGTYKEMAPIVGIPYSNLNRRMSRLLRKCDDLILAYKNWGRIVVSKRRADLTRAEAVALQKKKSKRNWKV